MNFDFICVCALVSFVFLAIMGFIFVLLFSSWDLYAVSVSGVVICWILLCLRRD